MYSLSIILVMGYNYRPMYIGNMSKLFFLEKTKLLWRISFVAGISNVVLNIIFIPIYGYEAAAVTTYLSLVYMGYAGFGIKSIRKNHTVKFYPLIWLTIMISLTLCAFQIVHFPSLIKILITLIYLIISIFCLLFLKRKLENLNEGDFDNKAILE